MHNYWPLLEMLGEVSGPLETSLQHAGIDLRSVHVRGACPGFREVALMGRYACVGRL